MTNSKTNGAFAGYTTQKLAPCRLMANLIALIDNWWHLYARLCDGEHHREAITSRPALLHGVGRLIAHSGPRTVKVSLQHEKSGLIAQAITAVSNTLQRFNAIAERWTIDQRWTLLLTHIFRRWLGGKWLGELPPPGRHVPLRLNSQPQASQKNAKIRRSCQRLSFLFTFLG